MKYKIIASILAADGARLGEEVSAVLNAGADGIHIDVMDNHYAQNLGFGPYVCASLRRYGIDAPFDVHLAVTQLDNLIPMFADAGATMITFHPEVSSDINSSVRLIHEYNMKVALAFSPTASLSILSSIEYRVDMLSIMGVNPGFGGQEFMSSAIEKIKDAREWINDTNDDIRLCVDGGISLKNIKTIVDAGADTFVMGTGIFDANDYSTRLQEFRDHVQNH